MEPMTLEDFEILLAQDAEYQEAERELRPYLELANDVVVLRIKAGWTQAQLARAVGTNQANISRLENALAKPTLGFVRKVAAALGAEMDVRLRRYDDRPEAAAQQKIEVKSTAETTAITEQTVVLSAVRETDLFHKVSTRTVVHC